MTGEFRVYHATQFAPPRSAARLVLRDRTIARLCGDGVAAITMCAPAGYGKTTLATQWLDRASAVPVWVSLRDDDDDVTSLWASIWRATRLARLGSDDRAGVGHGDLRTTTIGPLLEEIGAVDGPVALILDDAHVLRHEQAIASLDWFVARMPPNLTVLFTSRVPLNLPALSAIRARGAAVDLGPVDLRLPFDVAATVLKEQRGVRTSEDDVARIVDATDGWPAAIALVGMALAHGETVDQALSHSASDTRGLRALVDEGLAGNSRADLQLLREVSVLEKFDAEAVAAVTGRQDAWRKLMALSRRTGLIVALDDEARWWRLHQLVRDELYAGLGSSDPELRRDLHRRAAAHLERYGDLPGIVHHLLGARDYEAVADILTDVRSSAKIPRAQVGLAWLNAIPTEVLAANPRLAFWEGWASATTGDLERRNIALARGRVAAQATPVAPFVDWGDVEDFVIGSACFDDIGTSLAASERFLERYEHLKDLAAVIELRRATMLYLLGRSGEARVALDLLCANHVLTRPLELLVPSYRALCLMEVGEAALAAADVERAQVARKALGIPQDPIYIVSEQAAARVATEAGAPERGLALAANALRTVGGETDTVFAVPHLLLEVARADIALGRRDRADVALNQANEICLAARDAGALAGRISELRASAGLISNDSQQDEFLSRREIDVLSLLATSMSAPQIASELFVSPNTVRSHIKSIYRKLGATSRRQAVSAGRARGLLLGNREVGGQ